MTRSPAAAWKKKAVTISGKRMERRNLTITRGTFGLVKAKITWRGAHTKEVSPARPGAVVIHHCPAKTRAAGKITLAATAARPGPGTRAHVSHTSRRARAGTKQMR